MKWLLCFCGLLFLAFNATTSRGDALEKLTPDRLEAVRNSVTALQQQRVEIPRTGAYQEHRANLHVHSHWSHDSVGTIEEIVAAAQQVGTTVLMFTEHPEASYDFFIDGHQGMKNGVLMIPGAEMDGFLVYPTMSLRGVTPTSSQELSDLVRGRNGQLFVSHLEERMDWQIDGVTGIEMYNTHADFKDEKGMIAALKNPFRMLSLASMVQKYPQESFAALQKYPASYLKRFDELCAIAPHTGVSANDAHQNVGFKVRWIADDKGQLEDALGEKLLELNLSVLPDSENLLKQKKPGDVVFDMFLDRYENSLRHVATHLLLTEQTDAAVRECLDAGRAFVAFDWIADSRGFDFAAVHGTTRHEMGSQLPLAARTTLKAVAPLPVHWRLVRNGEVVQEADGQEFATSVEQPGGYRCEAWLDVAGERTIWILSNPIYLQAP
jgi:hypothetical protein